MKLKYFLLSIPLFLFACKTDPSNNQDASVQSETSESAVNAKVKELIDTYKAQLTDNSLDANKRSTVSNDLAQLLIGQKQFAEAGSTLQNALKTSFDGAASSKNIGLLASLYSNQLKGASNIKENYTAFKANFKDEAAMKTQLNGLIESARIVFTMKNLGLTLLQLVNM